MSSTGNVESIVKLKHLYFDKINFWRSGAKVSANDLVLNFTKSYEFNEAHDGCLVRLECNIHDATNAIIRLSVSVTGEFLCSETNLVRRDQLLRKNTLAILFPYVRSQISLVTAQPELVPIVLPPMNIESVFENSEES
ncbi:protein-export chaperone SecB [Flavonifractor sp. An306]|uniref:protein-export chaperone SecB n=1 Tax=Flavonifractor sp. An306 TaxID=1965629 RepID=UPI000B3A2169|nr:protein-export chaperone SecB [Flavonifractor sp. An306]OUO34058.1 hypothetical protein B5F88_16450 [Flavonifractor sp. An306]